MKTGATPAHIASGKGHTEILALLLANKADINAATMVQQFKIFKYLLLIDS
jgi:ankyrin repeat protein